MTSGVSSAPRPRLVLPAPIATWRCFPSPRSRHGHGPSGRLNDNRSTLPLRACLRTHARVVCSTHPYRPRHPRRVAAGGARTLEGASVSPLRLFMPNRARRTAAPGGVRCSERCDGRGVARYLIRITFEKTLAASPEVDFVADGVDTFAGVLESFAHNPRLSGWRVVLAGRKGLLTAMGEHPSPVCASLSPISTSLPGRSAVLTRVKWSLAAMEWMLEPMSWNRSPVRMWLPAPRDL